VLEGKYTESKNVLQIIIDEKQRAEADVSMKRNELKRLVDQLEDNSTFERILQL